MTRMEKIKLISAFCDEQVCKSYPLYPCKTHSDCSDKDLDHYLKVIGYTDVGETIKIKYFVPDLEPVVFKGDWCDLRAGESVDLDAGEFKMIRLGVGMILPEGYEARIVPRSSTMKNFGVIQTNHMGVIDNKYSGDDDEWHFPAFALRKTHIEKGDRICQFRIVRNQPEIHFDVVEHLNEKSRGGFGSTGIK